ncbi:MAG: radical SAM protein [Phycisphaerales bacterium]|nr:radical SAM protein [Phycisphaerales bacterium]
MSQNLSQDPLKRLFAEHSRHWQDNLYVYPVISRRSGGLSIGVNLNPDKACNFDCVYCQVDRTQRPMVRKVEPDVLGSELEAMVRQALSGELFDDLRFAEVPAAYRKIRDIAFSGDGEPTICPQFPAAVHVAAEVRRAYQLHDVKLLLLTDAAYLNKPIVAEALAEMDANNGEIWAKLDAGTEDYFRRINRSNVSLQTILDNLLEASRVRPLVIQSLWMVVDGEPPPPAEVEAFSQRLADMIARGGRFKMVQVYTIARHPAESFVSPLNPGQIEAVAARIRAKVDIPLETYGGG